MTIWDARSLASKKLKAAENKSEGRITFSTPLLDCDCLLCHIMGKDRSYLLSHNQDFLSLKDESLFFSLIEKRTTGLPIAYLTNTKDFYGYSFFVNENVLIPKPDTETLVETATAVLSKSIMPLKKRFYVADICTGSACIGLSLLRNFLDSKMNLADCSEISLHCTDISPLTLDVARKNVSNLLTINEQQYVQLFCGDLIEPLQAFSSYDLIVSNPPYVPSKLVDDLLQDGRSEPRLALDGDVGVSSEKADGLAIIRRLIPQVWKKLNDGGFFLIETGEYNATETAEIMKTIGFSEITTISDLSGAPRVTMGVKKC